MALDLQTHRKGTDAFLLPRILFSFFFSLIGSHTFSGTMSVFVVGGTGTYGREICRKLALAGNEWHVKCLSRSGLPDFLKSESNSLLLLSWEFFCLLASLFGNLT